MRCKKKRFIYLLHNIITTKKSYKERYCNNIMIFHTAYTMRKACVLFVLSGRYKAIEVISMQSMKEILSHCYALLND